MLWFFLQIEMGFQNNIQDHCNRNSTSGICWSVISLHFSWSNTSRQSTNSPDYEKSDGGRGKGPPLGNWCGPLHKSISKHLTECLHPENICIFTETTACVNEKPSVFLVLGKVGDLSSCRCKIQILFPCTTESTYPRPLWRGSSPPRYALPKRKGKGKPPQRSTTPGGSGGVGPSRRKHLSASNRCWGWTCSAPLPFPSTHWSDLKWWLGTVQLLDSPVQVSPGTNPRL